jgi:hypothetical protein
LACSGLAAKVRPCIHQPPPLPEHVAAAIGLFDLAPDHVRQRRFDNLVLEACAPARPCLERRAEAVRRPIIRFIRRNSIRNAM